MRKLAYGALFAVVLPLLLWAWAVRLDRVIVLPRVGEAWHGLVIAALGALVIAAAIVTLRVRGGGWPMSPFPPKARVTSGLFAIVDDPIYAGFVLLVAGVAIAQRSPSGIWIVAPLLSLACFSFVAGYERDATLLHFGPPLQRPFLRLPAASDALPSFADRLSMYVLVFLPWLIAYQAVNALGAPRDAHSGYSRWDALIPLVPSTEVVYFLAYPMVLALPLLLRSQRALRTVAIHGWVGTFAITLFYLAVPIVVVPKPVLHDALLAPLLLWERAFDAPLTALPAFHVVWVMIAAAAFANRFAWVLATVIAISCLTTGMHAIGDVIGGVFAGVLILNSHRLWRVALALSERLASSWREWDLGPVRLMSHGLWAAAGSFFGILIVGMLGGDRAVLPACVVGLSAILGAALWAQFIEGSPMLLRPYGYYGGIIGGSVAIAAAPLIGSDTWLLLAAYGIAAPVVQAFGRVRCLVQGCCHGRIAEETNGIRYRHPRSRVTRLSDLSGAPLHATQLYSIVSSIVAAIVLLRLWQVGAPLSTIGGGYFILNGMSRFVEEHYRGEPQTPIAGGLRIYQWLAIASVIVGALLTAFPTQGAPAIQAPSTRAWLIAALFGITTYCAYGLDFPRLNARFARLV
jgi:Prolipoprotein diacylglyceryltransferase